MPYRHPRNPSYWIDLAIPYGVGVICGIPLGIAYCVLMWK